MSSKCNLKVSFLTWNIYQGFDSSPLFAVSPGQLPETVTQVFRQFLATNFPVRAKAIAKDIASKNPDFIGLQEAVKIKLRIPTFKTVTYDFIDILLEALEDRGLKYRVAARNKDVKVKIPDSNGNTVRFLDRDAILIRKDYQFNVITKNEANFQTNLTIPLAGQELTIVRGWSYIDVKLDGKAFRVITTHLEPIVEGIRNAQADEILQGPANTSLPVVIMGDLNSIPSSLAYKSFIDAGFKDVWNEVGKGPGLSSTQKPDLLNAVSLLNERIDYVLFKNGWKPIEAELVGESQEDRTKTGLWPSDHAGVSASLNLVDHHGHHHHHNH